ncbi:coiled-coil domain-containing protein 27 [Anolis sagrei]|uniref:coiled-coil domain-containing protein 27 n=1 Tax=Anolis sagrei TaxID=38937 RepID=UPI003522830C
MDKAFTLMRKGFNELQEMGPRQQQNLVWNPPKSDKINPSKASKAVQEYYEKQTEDRRTKPTMSGYATQVEELQKSFLMRPGCPRYSHRATSTSHLETNFPVSSELPCNISTISLSSQLSLDEWAMVFQNPDLLESKSYVKFHPSSDSPTVSGLTKWQSYTEGCVPDIQLKSHMKGKVPWYIAALHEKDISLQKLGDELSRLASCEAECARKDDVISILREEVEAMQKQLQTGSERSASKEKEDEKESPGGSTKRETSDAWPYKRGHSLPIHLDHTNILEDFRREIEPRKSDVSQVDKIPVPELETLNDTLLKDQEDLEQFEKEFMEIQQREMMDFGDEMFLDSGSKESKEVLEVEGEAQTMQETDEELIVRKLFEFQRMNVELYEELQKAKDDYEVATGAISSLQRQLSFEGSQLRRAHAEQEMLQKELRERGVQLEAMSHKFCNLREERKHEEMMGSIERENNKLQRDIANLESNLADKSQLIDSLQSSVNQLQAELFVNHHHIGTQQTQQNELQRQLEVLQRVEQQTRVTLESISARFERFRSKIIQATYSTPGTKSPQAEITDDEVLEALQKIITDRLDFHQILRQKGIKVPSLISSEPSTPTSHKKKSPSR